MLCLFLHTLCYFHKHLNIGFICPYNILPVALWNIQVLLCYLSVYLSVDLSVSLSVFCFFSSTTHSVKLGWNIFSCMRQRYIGIHIIYLVLFTPVTQKCLFCQQALNCFHLVCISTRDTFFFSSLYSPSFPGTYSHSWISDQLPWLHIFFLSCKYWFERCEVIPSAAIRVTSWTCGMCEHVCMYYGLHLCVWGVCGCQSRCHLVTSLLQLDHLPDDPETARNTEESKSTCQNVRKCLPSHKQQDMRFNGPSYKFKKHNVSKRKKAQ